MKLPPPLHLAAPLEPYWWAADPRLLRAELRRIRHRWRERAAYLRRARTRKLRACSLVDAYPLLEGRRCCRCMAPLAGRRTRWCSAECSREAEIRCNPNVARFEVAKRDGGVCAQCGIDTLAPSKAVSLIQSMIDERQRRVWGTESDHWWKRVSYALTWRAQRWRGAAGHYYEVDHILPVIDGGGLCGLENLRTLCRRCHPERRRKAPAPLPLLEMMLS